MSGGSMDYFFGRMEEITHLIPDLEIRALWKDLCTLMHDIEWYTSGDYGDETYSKAVMKFKNKWFGPAREEILKQVLNDTFEQILKDTVLSVKVEK
jgi:hypothetical protein